MYFLLGKTFIRPDKQFEWIEIEDCKLSREVVEFHLANLEPEYKSHNICDLIKVSLNGTINNTHYNMFYYIYDSTNVDKYLLVIDEGTTYNDLEPYIEELPDDEKNEIKALLMELKLIK